MTHNIKIRRVILAGTVAGSVIAFGGLAPLAQASDLKPEEDPAAIQPAVLEEKKPEENQPNGNREGERRWKDPKIKHVSASPDGCHAAVVSWKVHPKDTRVTIERRIGGSGWVTSGNRVDGLAEGTTIHFRVTPEGGESAQASTRTHTGCTTPTPTPSPTVTVPIGVPVPGPTVTATARVIVPQVVDRTRVIERNVVTNNTTTRSSGVVGLASTGI